MTEKLNLPLKTAIWSIGETRQQGRINHYANRENALGLALEYQNTPLLVFHVFKLFTTRQNCRALRFLRLVYKLRKVTTLAFIVFDWLKQHHALWPKNYIEISASMCVRINFSRGGNVEILLILLRLLTMQCKWTFIKRLTLSIPLVSAGWTSILNLLSEMFYTLSLSEMFFFS